MAVWIGAVRLPDTGFSLRDPDSDAQVTMRPRDRGEWEIIARAYDSTGTPVQQDAKRMDTHNPLEIRRGDAFIRLTPLPPGQTRSSSAPATGPNDVLLEMKAFASDGRPVFDIRHDRIVSIGLEIQVFGPNLRDVAGSS